MVISNGAWLNDVLVTILDFKLTNIIIKVNVFKFQDSNSNGNLPTSFSVETVETGLISSY